MFEKNILGDNSFIIAEVGQNHQGDLDIAREYIKIFSMLGANAIKFQTRNNKILFDESAYHMHYNSENAFADTYGEHREKLELKPEWIPLLRDECHKHGALFMSTPFDEESLDLLSANNIDIIKVASFDLGNMPFLEKIAQTKIPVVLSTGGGSIRHILDSVDIIKKHNNDIAIMHCVSEYPCEYNRLGLEKIKKLSELFPQNVIGLSDHFNGTLSGPLSYLLGARVFEKHVTFNRSWKGTDHSFALEPEGFRKFTRDIRRVKDMLVPIPDDELGKEPVFKKLGKSIIAKYDLKNGTTLSSTNITGKIFTENFVPVRESSTLLGKKINKDIHAGQPIQFTDIIQ